MKNFIQRLLTACVLISLLVGMYNLPNFLFTCTSILMLLYILIFEWPALCKNSLALQLLTPAYLFMPFLCLILLHNSIYKQILALLYICVASFDTGAYAFGRLVGRHALAPKISPAKTWEGVFGGIFFIISIITVFLWHQNSSFSLSHFLILLTTCFLAILGDLFESWLKRRAEIKDSGSILPGHGGLLDRFDSLLFTLPFFYLLRKTIFTLFFG